MQDQKALYGIIGYPLTVTFSPSYFADKFRKEGINAPYKSFPLAAITAFPHLLESQPALRGLNVTIPYKTAVIPYLDDLTDDAMTIGAVNCISIDGAGKAHGHNTDWLGFSASLKPELHPSITSALILGTGGASKAITYALQRLGISFRLVSRSGNTGALQYHEVTKDLVHDNLLIINTTPLGMSPNDNSLPPLPYNALTPQHLLYDLVYTPPVTGFLAAGMQHGAATKNGLDMLHLQAEASWQIWQKAETGSH